MKRNNIFAKLILAVLALAMIQSSCSLAGSLEELRPNRNEDSIDTGGNNFYAYTGIYVSTIDPSDTLSLEVNGNWLLKFNSFGYWARGTGSFKEKTTTGATMEGTIIEYRIIGEDNEEITWIPWSATDAFWNGYPQTLNWYIKGFGEPGTEFDAPMGDYIIVFIKI